jgi:hypothetical protein
MGQISNGTWVSFTTALTRFHSAARAQLFDLYEYIATETGRDLAALSALPAGE